MCALSDELLQRLPLSAEPVGVWSKTNDLFLFLSDLCDEDAEVVDESGTRSAVSYRKYGETLYKRGISKFRKAAREFRRVADRYGRDPMPGATQVDEAGDLLKDSNFGLMAKHVIASSSVIETFLSESRFFSLPHILEAAQDLECSVLLAENLYYKQPLQVLRGILELNVLHLHFVGDQGAFKDWQDGSYRVPKLRGRSGLLNQLEAGGAIPSSVANVVAALYADLNGAIHSAEAKMVNKGLIDGRWSGLQFKSGEFQAWCSSVCKVATVSMHLLFAVLQEIQRQPKAEGLLCDTCRTANQFTVEERSGDTVTVRCVRCGSELHLDLGYAAQFGFV